MKFPVNIEFVSTVEEKKELPTLNPRQVNPQDESCVA